MKPSARTASIVLALLIVAGVVAVKVMRSRAEFWSADHMQYIMCDTCSSDAWQRCRNTSFPGRDFANNPLNDSEWAQVQACADAATLAECGDYCCDAYADNEGPGSDYNTCSYCVPGQVNTECNYPPPCSGHGGTCGSGGHACCQNQGGLTCFGSTCEYVADMGITGVTSTVSPATVSQDGSITLTITLTNASAATAQVVRVSLSVNEMQITASGPDSNNLPVICTNNSCFLGDILGGASLSFPVTFTHTPQACTDPHVVTLLSKVTTSPSTPDNNGNNDTNYFSIQVVCDPCAPQLAQQMPACDLDNNGAGIPPYFTPSGPGGVCDTVRKCYVRAPLTCTELSATSFCEDTQCVNQQCAFASSSSSSSSSQPMCCNLQTQACEPM